MLDVFRAIWRYRGFIAGSVKREFQLKYRNSLLGAAWTLLNPLAMISVYTVVFAEIMRSRLPGVESRFAYSIYLCAGILAWGLFAEIVGRSQTMFLDNANLIKKLQFPRLCLPVIVLVNAALNFAIIFGIFTAFLVVSGNFPGKVFFTLPLVWAVQILFALGLGVLLGVLNVFFRDVGQLFTIVIQFWFWLTPIVYSVRILPEAMQRLIRLNPMTPLVGAYQSVLVNGKSPDWSSLLPVFALAVVLCALGMRLFRKRVGEMVDEL
jgi:lipopolysaccharide transport system permease protein